MFNNETDNIHSNTFGNTPKFIKSNDVTDNFAINYQKYPRPVPYGPIKIIKNTEEEYKVISYTDCMEISLLRFLHMIFGNKGKMELKQHSHLQCHNELVSYLFDKVFSYDVNYYETKIGFQERANWCNFLNERDIFKYKKNNLYEVCASLENLFSFFSYFFNISFENKSYQDNLNNLANLLSTEDKKLRFELYNFGNKSTNSFYMNSYIKIFVNDDNLYDWEIYQYFYVENNCITERETGHSDYRNSIHMKNFLINANSEKHFSKIRV